METEPGLPQGTWPCYWRLLRLDRGGHTEDAVPDESPLGGGGIVLRRIGRWTSDNCAAAQFIGYAESRP